MTATVTEQVFRLPDLGEGLTEAEITEWRVSVGDVVAVDQIVVEVETAKAAVEVPIPIAGTVVTLYGEPGAVVDVGAPLVAVAGPDERYREEERAGSGNVLVGYGTSGPRRSRRRASRVPARPAQTPPREVPRVISPVVRRLAREHGIEVAALAPTGPRGVVLRRDVEAAIADGTEARLRAVPDPTAADGSAGAVPPAGAAPRAFGTRDADDAREPEEPAGQESQQRPEGTGEAPVRIPIRGLRRTMADRLARSRSEIPDAGTWVDVDATPLVELKAELDRDCPEARIGILAIFARICVAGLRRFPDLNAHVDTERQEIVQLPRVHLGFAAQTDRGLVVPVVHDAHRLSLAELAARLRERTEDARSGRLTPRQLTGGTFTLNNYGVFGVDGSTPIINHPEAAMLGVGRIIDRPWAFEGELRLRKVTQLSVTFDHRVCDGGVAGGFLRFVADCVERPRFLITNL